MTVRPVILILLVASAFSIACESNRATESTQPSVDPLALDPSVLTTLEVLPSTVTLEQGSTVQLEVFARDQRGVLMSNLGGVTFSSSDRAVAQVSSSGMVTGLTAGTTDISVTKTVAAVTRTAEVKATIRQAAVSASLLLMADLERGWQPAVAHLQAGGIVRWVTAGSRSWSDIPHRMLYLLDKGYSIVDSLDLSSGSAALQLTTKGQHRYCSAGCWDPPDFGIIYVH